MGKFKFSNRSLEKLQGVHPHLVDALSKAINESTIDFGISSGVRTFEEQAELVDKGVSWTYFSRHLFGLAVDIFIYKNGKARFGSAFKEEYRYVYELVQSHVPKGRLDWGGDWTATPDIFHLELSKEFYKDDPELQKEIIKKAEELKS